MRKVENRDTVWTFRVAEKIAQRTQITLEENTCYWAEQLKTWFYGYKTRLPLKATLWGLKIDLEIKIAPYGTPTETLPVVEKADSTSKTLSVEKQERIGELQARIAAIKATIPEDADEKLENRYWEHLDRDLFLDSYQQAVAVWNRDADSAIRYLQVGELLTKMYNAIHDLKLPDELMRNDTKFNEMVVQMLLFVEKVEHQAQANSIELPAKVHELSVFLDRFSDQLTEGGNRLFGIKREMTDEQRNEAVSLTTAAFDNRRPLEERLEILNQLCENPLIDTDDRLIFLEKFIELIRNGMKRPKPIPCPYNELIKRHLSGISRYLHRLEQDGSAVWFGRVAEDMFSTLQSWREDTGMSARTKEEFAEMLYPTSAIISTHEQASGGIDYELELFFLDREDSFSGHVIYVSVKNEDVHEILLMG